MNILIGLFSVIGMIYCVSTFKSLMAQLVLNKETESIDIKGESILFFLCLFNLINLIFC